MPYRKRRNASEPHPLDAVIWRALTSVQESLAEGDERARRYPAAIAPFAATIDTEPASFRSLLALVGGDDRIALFTTEEVEPPSAFSVVRRDSVDQMVFEDADACAAQPGAPIVALGVADVPEMLALASVTQPGPFGPRTIELATTSEFVGKACWSPWPASACALTGSPRSARSAWNLRIADTVSQPTSSDRWLHR